MKIDATNWQQLSKLLDEALELGEAERLQWLASLPEDMAELRPTLQELLAQHTGVETGDFLAKPPDFAAALLAEHAHAQWAEHEFQVGKVIGAYRLIRELGRGGMGAVWLAERVDGKLKRQVALKFPYAGPNQRQLAERLVREREILASLEHPNIARLYDADVTTSGQPFLVLEYIDGIPITEYCDQQKLNIDIRLKLFQQVLEAVRYAHAHLVIHRDLKPSNILITSDGIAHLLDFGIAKLVVNGEVKETALTHIGGHALTPDYASPEQLTGTVITTVSDVYSLGVLLYKLLTGSRPYRLQRDTRSALEEVIVAGNIMLPSRADIDEQIALNRNTSMRQLRTTLAGDLDTLTLKALKKAPSDRYASADAFLDDVKRYINKEPILAQADSQWYRLRKFVSRNRMVIASVAAIVVALIIGSSAALWQAHIAKQQRDRAVASAARSEAVSDFLQLMVTEVADGNQPITMEQLIARSEDIANRTYVGNADQQAAILEVLGSYYLKFNHADKANEAFNKALAIEAKNPDQALRAKLLCSSAIAQFLLGNRQLAQRNMSAGISIAYNEPYSQAVCLDNRAYLKAAIDDLDGELSDLQRAQEQLLQSGVNKPVFAVSLMTDMAGVYANLGRSDDAERLYSEAAELLNQLGRGETTDAADLQNDWGSARAGGGDQLGALQHYDKALALAAKRGMNVDQNTGSDVNRALTLHQLARDEEAIAIYRRVIEHARKDGAVAMVVFANQGMAHSLLALGRISEAEKIIDEVISMIGKQLPDHGIYSDNIMAIQAMLAMKQHRYQDAMQNYSKVIDSLMAHHVSGTHLSYALTRRGQIYLAESNLSAALIDATAAWEKGHSAQGNFPYSDASGNAALLLAKIHLAKNENNETQKWAAIAFQQLQGSLGAEHPSTLEAKKLLANASKTNI